MSTAAMTERIAEASPRLKARIAGVFYLLCFVTGIFALLARSRLGSAARPHRGRVLYRGNVDLLLQIQAGEPEPFFARRVHQPRGMRHWAS